MPVKKKPGQRKKPRGTGLKTGGPVSWAGIPHDEIWAGAQEAMSVGSTSRAREDALRFVLKRRLPRLDAEEHLQYIELECARIVETLRFLRDEYRTYLKARGCSPVVEMYWVVFRYGVMDSAVMVLRSAAAMYIGESRIRTDEWDGLFDFSGPFGNLFNSSEPPAPVPPVVQCDQRLLKTIEGLLPKNVFDEVRTGGPFGRDAQRGAAQSFPGKTFVSGCEMMPDVIERRSKLWDDSRPWT